MQGHVLASLYCLGQGVRFFCRKIQGTYGLRDNICISGWTQKDTTHAYSVSHHAESGAALYEGSMTGCNSFPE